MSVTLLLDVLTHVAKTAAKSIPKSQTGAVSQQVEIYGWTGSTMAQQAKAASHNESVEIATIAAVLGVGTAILATPYILGGAALTGGGLIIAEAVVSIGVSGISGSIIQILLQETADAINDYRNGDALKLKDLADKYGWPQIQPDDDLVPSWMPQVIAPIIHTPGIAPPRGGPKGDPLVLVMECWCMTPTTMESLRGIRSFSPVLAL